MVWFRVDDVLPFHQRVIEAGNAAMGLWVRAGAWSSGQLTDGFIPKTIARQIGTAAEIRRLVQSGLWIEEGTGYRFHAWLEDGTGAKRQPTRAEVETQRKAERDRKAAYRAGRKDAHQDTDRSPASVPAGVPVGQTPGHPADVRQASGHPDPTRPDPLPSEGGARGATPPVENSEPPTRCPAHLATPTPPKCGACKDARIAAEAWTLQRAGAAHPSVRRAAWDPATHCEHGQLHGKCEACEQEARDAAKVIHGRFGGVA